MPGGRKTRIVSAVLVEDSDNETTEMVSSASRPCDAPEEKENVPPGTTAQKSSRHKAKGVDGVDNAEGNQNENGGPEHIDDLPVRELSFVLEIFSFIEMRKKVKDRAAINTRFSLNSDEPFDTFKAQVLNKIANSLKPSFLCFEDYSLTYTIKRKQRTTSLQTEEDYGFLISLDTYSEINISVMQMKKPAAKKKQRKHTEESSSDGSEEDSGDESDEPAPKKQKTNRKGTKVRKAKDISPENKIIAEAITQLKTHWCCNDKKCQGGTGYCWINPDDSAHIPLGHSHFNVWASAIARDDGTATQQNLPNNHLFDNVPSDKKGPISPLLQARINAKAKDNPTIPSFVVNMPPPQYSFPPHPNHFISDQRSSPISTSSLVESTKDHLIPENLQPGPDMIITEFCATYTLDDQVLQQFTDEGYRTTASFQHILVPDLLDANFRRGDVAEVKAAVLKWATSHST